MTSKKVEKKSPELVYQASAYVEPLYAYAKVLQSFSDETLYDLGPEGLYARQTDPAHVAMVEASLGRLAFQELGKVEGKRGVGESLGKEGIISFATDNVSLVNALRWARRRKAPTVALELREARGGGEVAYLLSVAYPGVRRAVATLSTKDFETRSKLPHFSSLPARVGGLQATRLRSALDEASDLADAVRLRAFRGKGPSRRDRFVLDTYLAERGVEFEQESDGREERYVEDDAKTDGGVATDVIDAHYPLDYLDSIVRVCSSRTLSLRWGFDYPIEVEWDVTRYAKVDAPGGGFVERDVPVGHVKALLAPRVDRGDMDEA